MFCFSDDPCRKRLAFAHTHNIVGTPCVHDTLTKVLNTREKRTLVIVPKGGKQGKKGKKGKKANKIMPAAPKVNSLELKYEQKIPNYSRGNRRNVTTVVPTRIGNVIRINLAENDGHRLPASWCFSHKKLHQHSKLRRTMSWWYTLQFLLQVFVVIITLSMPYITVPSSVGEARANVDSQRRFLSTATNDTSTSSNSYQNNAYYNKAREALENSTFQSLLLSKSIFCAMCLLLTVARSRKRRGLLQICTKYCHWLIELIFIFITLGSIYGFYMLKNDAIPRYIAITCECVTMITSLIAKCHERRLHKRAARVRPIGMTKLKQLYNRSQVIDAVCQLKRKNKIVSRKKKGRKGLFSFSSDSEERSKTKVV